MGGILGKNISIQLSPYAYTTKEDTYLHPRLKWTEKWNDNTQEQTGDLNNDSLNKMQTDYPNYLVLPEYPYSSVPTYLSTHYYDSLNDGFYINNNICSGSVLGKQGNIDHLPDHFEDNATQLIISTNLPVFINEEDARAWVNSGYSDTSKICNKYLEPADADSLLLRRNMMPNWVMNAFNTYNIIYSCDVDDLLWNRYWGRGISRNTNEPVLFVRGKHSNNYTAYNVISKNDTFTYNYYRNEAHTETFDTGYSSLNHITTGAPFLTPHGNEFHLFTMTYSIGSGIGQMFGATKSMGANRNVGGYLYGDYEINQDLVTNIYSTNIKFDPKLLVAIDWLLF